MRTHEAVRRVALFMDRGFKTWQPDLYLYYEDYMLRLRRAHPHLRWNWEPCVFAAATFNLGPRSIAHIHTDHKNFAAGWCGILALGNFDPKKGGHLVLWDLKLVIEFPPGTVMYIPSAILRHSNTTIAQGEKRRSFTQFTAGGLFRWVDCDFQTKKKFEAQGFEHDMNGNERWKDASGRYILWEELLKRAS
ncbi:hypothetical protein L226DRAFT_543486 [Lentinus tigrinus ALCF2SS1-7]|uniref:uncharacterized protein n=1 Tax=Lentinus tigrinus ALCF2SS1-7 TaxID=1328758 RepID=UPI0011662923|nr:hypothetical protein L226DRAFT_543486 [Lentinus tigrinus ALCF2SS1-7]